MGAAQPKIVATLKGQRTQLCSGHSSANPDSQWAKITDVDRTGLDAEKIAQEEQFGLIAGCRIKTRPGRTGRGIIVEIFLGKAEDQDRECKDFDFNQKVGQQYGLLARTLFPVGKDTFKTHPIFGQPETAAWEINIMKKTADSNAPIVGFVRNHIPDIQLFLGTDQDVSLLPIPNDVLAKRATATVTLSN